MSTTSNIPFINTIEVQRNVGFHSSIFRGKCIGTSLRAEQSAAIAAMAFDDLYTGDYWTINGMNWRIADINVYYRKGDPGGGGVLMTPHVVVVPDEALYKTAWNDTDDTTAGYVNSAIRANIKGSNTSTSGAEAKFIAAFGDEHVLSYRAQYPSKYTNGVATEAAWVDARVELLSETAVYGAPFLTYRGSMFEAGIDTRQLSMFRLNPSYNYKLEPWWLRNVGNASRALFEYNGQPGILDPTRSDIGVRPFALIA